MESAAVSESVGKSPCLCVLCVPCGEKASGCFSGFRCPGLSGLGKIINGPFSWAYARCARFSQADIVRAVGPQRSGLRQVYLWSSPNLGRRFGCVPFPPFRGHSEFGVLGTEDDDEDDDEDDSWNLRPSPNLWGNRLVFVFFAFLAVGRLP
jgi:hypothetical protein